MSPIPTQKRGASGQSPDRVLLVILLASLAIKIALAIAVDHLDPVLDEKVYATVAETLSTEGAFTNDFRPPLYPGFLALIFNLGGRLTAIRIVQTVLSTVTVLLVFRVVQGTFDTTIARIAAGVVAFDPVLIAFTHFLWSETLFLFLFWCMTAALLLPPRRGSLWRWLIAGLFLGSAGLTRPVVLGLGPVIAAVALWTAWRGRGGREERGTAGGLFADPPGPPRHQLSGICLLAVGALAVVLPWTFRNHRHTGEFVLVDTNAPFNFLVGADPGAVFRDKDDYWDRSWAAVDGVNYRRLASRRPGEAQRRAMQIAMEQIGTDPILFVRKSLWEGGHLLTLDSFVLRHLRNGWYGDKTPGWVLPLAVVISIPWSALLIALGAIGCLQMARSPLRTFIRLNLLYFLIIFALAYSLSRYQVPLRPLLAVAAVSVLVNGRDALARLIGSGRSLPRGIALLVILIFLALAWARDLPIVYDMMANGGRDHQMTIIDGSPQQRIGKPGD
jgi:4-amino-4-deoxy-L-arabinose transferase-like glycosyltransferase